MAVVDELVTVLGAEISPGSNAALKKFGAGIDGIKNQLANLGVVVTGALAAAGYFVKSVSDEAAALDKLSEQTGVSTDTLQEFDYAAQQVGASSEALRGDILSLQKSMSSPIPGQFNMELAMLGVSARKSSGELKTTDELLLDMSDKFAKMDAQKASQWASKVGVSDDTLLLLRKGREGIEELREEAHKLGGIIPANSIKIAAEFKKNLAELQFAIKGIGSQIAIATIPALNKLVDGFKNFIVANREWLSLGLESIMGGLVAGFERFFSLIAGVGDKFTPIIDKIKEFLPEMEGVEFVTHLVTGALTGLVALLSPIIVKLTAVGLAVAAASMVLEDFFTYLEGGSSLTGKLFDGFQEKYPEVYRSMVAIGELVSKIFIERIQTAWKVIKEWGAVILDVIGGFMNMLNNILGPVNNFFSTFEEKFPALSKLIEAFGEGVKNILGGAFEYALKAVQEFFEVAFKIIEEIFGAIGGVVETVAGFGEGVADFLGFGSDEEKQAVSAVPGNLAFAPVAAHGNNYNNSKGDTIINMQLSTNDPNQMAKYLQDNIGADQVNSNTPGGFGPNGF